MILQVEHLIELEWLKTILIMKAMDKFGHLEGVFHNPILGAN